MLVVEWSETWQYKPQFRQHQSHHSMRIVHSLDETVKHCARIQKEWLRDNDVMDEISRIKPGHSLEKRWIGRGRRGARTSLTITIRRAYECTSRDDEFSLI